MVPSLLPHLVSRIVLTGTGGVDQFGRLCISPRLSWIEKTVSDSSTNNRGFAEIKSDTHSSFGTRIQIISSDQIFSAQGIFLQTGITALALRLAEIRCLPETDICWFEIKRQLNEMNLDAYDDVFAKAVEYQQNLLERSQEYVTQCSQQEFFSIFSSDEEVTMLFDLWQRKLDLLRQFIESQNFDLIAGEFEWAKKYQFVKALRDRKNLPLHSRLLKSEIWLLAESVCFEPAHSLFESMQEPFLDWEEFIPKTFSTPRAAARNMILEELYRLNETYGDSIALSMDWDKAEFRRMKNVAEIRIENPFAGRPEDVNELVENFVANMRGYGRFSNKSGNVLNLDSILANREIFSR